ncbi:MAG: hypothetical protein M1131_07010 [Actinobacteria bacterium]|nr:hypothetical protein [Actinomycetota bacterium]MCL6094494.1 hypothetical protein [Actinomycetota bacterium]
MTRFYTTHSAARSFSILLMILLGITLASCSSTAPKPKPPTEPKMPSHAVSQNEISSSYATLFDLSNPHVSPKVAVVQDGSSLRATFTNAVKLPLAKAAIGATVTKVDFLGKEGCSEGGVPYPCAKVTYDIMGTNGKPLLTNSTGYAIFEHGKWLVAKTTICGLLSLATSNGGKVSTPPGCA